MINHYFAESSACQAGDGTDCPAGWCYNANLTACEESKSLRRFYMCNNTCLPHDDPCNGQCDEGLVLGKNQS